MKTSIQKISCFSSTGSKLVCTLIFASLISVFSISSALAERGEGHGRGNRGEWHHHQEWRGNHEDYGRYQPRYQQPYFNYAQPVFVPPPVYYAPQQSPGINLFFPLNLHR
jgi:hypothetical protein